MNNVVTGATGFVGANLVNGLLEQGRLATCIARPTKSMDEQRRMDRALFLASGKKNDNTRNLKTFRGDLTEENFGCSKSQIEEIKNQGRPVIWHSAGSLNFSKKPEDAEATWLTNVGGMQNVLNFAEEVNAKAIFYVGTFYSDGNKNVKTYYKTERPIFNNPYEKSKYDAKELFFDWSKKNSAVRTVVFEPSIVWGNSKDGRAFNFSGYYRFFQSFYVFKEILEKRNKTRLSEETFMPMWVTGHGEVKLNLVYIDWVIDLMMKIRDSGANGTFSLINENEPSFQQVVDNSLAALGISGIRLLNGQDRSRVEKINNNPRLENKLQKLMVDYAPYVMSTFKGDMSKAREVLGDKFIPHPVIDADVFKMMINFAVPYKFNLLA